MNSNGTISISEYVRNMVGKTNLDGPALSALWHEIDVNRDGVLDAREFVQLQLRIIRASNEKDERIRIMWRLFDRNGDGRLENAEFHAMVRSMKFNASQTNYLVSQNTTSRSIYISIAYNGIFVYAGPEVEPSFF